MKKLDWGEVRKYVDMGLTDAEVGAKVGRCSETIRHIRSGILGIKRPTRVNKKVIDRALVKKYIDKNLSDREVSEKVGCSQQIIFKIRNKEFKIKKRKLSGYEQIIVGDKARDALRTVVRTLYNKGFRRKDLKELTGLNSTVIANLLVESNKMDEKNRKSSVSLSSMLTWQQLREDLIPEQYEEFMNWLGEIPHPSDGVLKKDYDRWLKRDDLPKEPRGRGRPSKLGNEETLKMVLRLEKECANSNEARLRFSKITGSNHRNSYYYYRMILVDRGLLDKKLKPAIQCSKNEQSKPIPRFDFKPIHKEFE